jgi:N-formylglutamate amidohydrolase
MVLTSVSILPRCRRSRRRCRRLMPLSPRVSRSTASTPGSGSLRAQALRTVIDVNRDPSGASLNPGQITTGLVPNETFDSRLLYRDGAAPPPKEIERRKELFFTPYQAALAEELARLRGLHKRVPSRLPPFALRVAGRMSSTALQRRLDHKDLWTTGGWHSCGANGTRDAQLSSQREHPNPAGMAILPSRSSKPCKLSLKPA